MTIFSHGIFTNRKKGESIESHIERHDKRVKENYN